MENFIPLFSIFSTYLEPQVITDQIAKEFEKTKNHYRLYQNLQIIFSLLSLVKTLGFKIGVYGRFNASTRTKKVYINYRTFPVNTYQQRINYSLTHSHARIGSFGIKL